MTAQTDPLPQSPGDARRAWVVTWTLLFGLFCVGFTITILSVSRPAIARDLHADPSSLVWLISGPTMATALVSASSGKLGDLRGHRLVYLVGMSGASVFAVASALAWSGPSLIAFRIVGAAIGAACGPSSLAVISRLFPPHRRSAALGYWSLVGAGGPVIGLVAGGPLVDAFGWRTIFWMQAPLMVAAALLAARMLDETPRRHDVRLDGPGQAALVAVIGFLLFGVDRGRVWGWGSPAVVGAFVAAAVAGAALLVVERRAVDPLVPLRYFGRRSFTVPVAVQFFANFGYMGGFILAPKLLDEVRHLSPGTIALLLVPRPLTFAVCGTVAGYLVPRLGVRFYAVMGTVCVTASLAVLAAVAAHPSSGWVVLAIAVSGVGMGSAQPAIAASVANSVDDGDLGVAGATQQLVAQLGASLGMNVLDTVQVGRVAAVGVAASFSQTYVVGAVVSGGGVLAALALRRAGRSYRPARTPAVSTP